MKRFRRSFKISDTAILRLLHFGYSPKEAEEFLGISSSMFHHWYQRGKFEPGEAAVIGRVLYADPKALEKLRDGMNRE